MLVVQDGLMVGIYAFVVFAEPEAVIFYRCSAENDGKRSRFPSSEVGLC